MTALILSLLILAADPVPLTVDQLVERVAGAQKAEAAAKVAAQKTISDANAKTAAATAELRAALAALNAKLKELGLDGPPPPPEPGPAPRPVDPLAGALKAAFLADASPADPVKKREALAELVELYKQAVGLAKSADLGSVAAVIAKVKAAGALIGLQPTDLVGVRTAIGAELKLAFPADSPLDETSRGKLAAAFARIHAALSAVQP